MSGRGVIGAIAAVACFAGAAPAMAATGPYGVTSDNVTHVRNIAKHADSSGARLKDGYFYITTGRDLSIYDVSTPEDPQEVGSLMLPEVAEPAFAEEDVDTNGRILLVENQGTLFVIDVTDKANPVVTSELTGAAVHTITCVMDCSYAYGDNGKIFDLRDPSAPKLLTKSWRTLVPGIESWHDVTEVAPGLILTASQPIALIDARMDPANPTLARTTPPVADRFVHATRWPRGGTDEFLLVGGEAVGPLCGDSDSATFSTWDAQTFTEIDEYRAPTGLPSEGRAPDSSFCTHWFQEHPNYADGGLMAISWYEHGTKFLRVSSEGQITEDGYYLPNAGQASAAYWITDRVVYVADYLRGLDVLRFEGDVGGARPGPATDPTPPAPQPAAEAAAKADPRRDVRRYLSIASNRSCVGRRGLRVSLRARPPERLRGLAVYVNGRRVARLGGRRLRRRNYVRLPRLNPMIVRVAAKTRSGRVVATRKAYRRCGVRASRVLPAGALGPRSRAATTFGALCYLR